MEMSKVDPKEIPVTGMDLTYKYYWSVPTLQMCRNTIRQHLFSNGIKYKGTNTQSRQLFNEQIMQDYWLPFCEDSLDSALCNGFVVWRTRKINGTRVPIVCQKDTYRLKMKIQDGITEYAVYDIGEKANEVIKDAHVYDDFGYRPLTTGKIMSIISTLVSDIEYYYTMVNCQVKLEKKRVNPPILTQINERKGVSTGENEGIDYDFYADADIAGAEQDAKYKRNRQAVEELKEQQKLYDDFFNPSASVSKPPDVLNQMVPIPSGQTIAPYNIQQGRNDIPVILKQLQDSICGVLGVPKSMIMSDTPHKSDVDGTHRVFKSTILWWKRQLSEMCQMIFNIINTKQIANSVNEKISKRKKTSTQDIYLATKNLQSIITFPVTPFVSNQELYELYLNGVLDWKTYCTYISRNTSIPLDKIPEEPEKPEARVSKKQKTN